MAEINATLSFHMDSRHNDKHDLRQIYVPYVDTERSKNNYYYAKNMTREDAFEYLFGDAVFEYNKRQNRPDRKITNYLDKLLESEERQRHTIREMRAQGASFKELAKFKKCVHPSYQFIVAIGNMQDNPEFMSKDGAMSDVAKAILVEYMNGFQERNPNAFLYQGATHGDEQGVWHNHCSIIWYADGFTKGMKRQVSQKKALEQMGFVSDTKKGVDGKLHFAIEKWQNREREIIKSIAKSYGVSLCSGCESREHLDREHYIIKKQKEECATLLKDANEKARKVLSTQEKVDAQLSDIKNFIENTDNGAVYSIYAENRENKEKISEYEKKNRQTYFLFARLWEEYKQENAQYWEKYRADKNELFASLQAVRTTVKCNKEKLNDCLYSLLDSSQSLLGKLISIIELLALLVEDTIFERKLANIEQSYRELKDNARVVLQASKDTSIALKSKDIDNVENTIQNWNRAIQKIDDDLQLQFRMLDERYTGR